MFWPYKKMDATSSPRSFDRPEYWDEVVAFSDSMNVNPTDLKERRPSFEHSRTALQGVLENIKFENSRQNDGYVKALGLGK